MIDANGFAQIFWMLFVIGVLCVGIARAIDDDDTPMATHITRLLLFLGGFLLAYRAILDNSAEVNGAIAWVRAHPGDILVFQIALALVWATHRTALALSRVGPGLVNSLIDAFGRKKTGKPIKEETPTPTPLFEEDARIASAHEAGHVLLYACLAEVPDDLVAEIGRNPIFGDGLGRVRSALGGKVFAELKSDEFNTWNMLLCLSGFVAEELLLGRRHSGAGSDMAQWETVARNYLASGVRNEVGSGSYYFVNPQAKFEEGCSIRALAELKDEQERIVRRYLRTNQDILREIADLLKAKGRLDATDLRGPLQQCVLTEGLPEIRN